MLIDGRISDTWNATIKRGFATNLILLTNGSHVTFQNVTISGEGVSGVPNTSRGCLIYLSGGSSAVLGEGCVLTNNDRNLNASGEHNGGAVEMYGNCRLTINGGAIRNCRTRIGTALAQEVQNYGSGGAIYSKGQNDVIEIVDGEISDCSAGYEGGAVAFENPEQGVNNGSFLMTGGTIRDCRANGNGAGIAASEGTRVSILIKGGTLDNCDCSVTENAWDGLYRSMGGGIYNNGGSVVIQNGTVSGCRATYGGGVYVRNGSFQMSGGVITGCSAVIFGGGVECDASGADGSGGMTAVMTGGTITGCDVAGHNSLYSNGTGRGGGVCVSGAGASFTIDGGVITQNRCNMYGGGVHVQSGAECTLNSGTVSYNLAGPASNGMTAGAGGIHVTADARFYMNGGEICFNEARTNLDAAVQDYWVLDAQGNNTGTRVSALDQPVTHASAWSSLGGGIHCSYTGTLVFHGGSIHDNTAGKQGGGININTSGIILVPADSTFCMYGNTAGRGGAILNDGGRTEGNGGAFYVCGVSKGRSDEQDVPIIPEIYIHGGSVYGNTADVSGGAIYMTPDERTTIDAVPGVTINGGSITDNRAAAGNGGALYVQNGTQLTLNGNLNSTLISRNTAGANGGAIYADDSAVTVSGANLISNTAANGGGIYLANGASMTYANGVIRDNHAEGDPMDFPKAGGTANAASHRNGVGGGVYVAKGALTVQGTGEGSQEVGIYHNTATYAADDVFSSGVNGETSITIPTVGNMVIRNEQGELVGTDLDWYKDYVYADTQYQNGIVLGGGDVSGTDILRYRDPDHETHADLRKKVSNETVDTGVDGQISDPYHLMFSTSKYVCLTLGYAPVTSLTVAKTLLGGEEDTSFGFRILISKDGQPVEMPPSPSYTVEEESPYAITFSLKGSGQEQRSLEIEGIPLGDEVRILETGRADTGLAGYYTSFRINGQDPVLYGSSCTIDSIQEPMVIDVYNNPGTELPATGGPGTLPYTVSGVLLILTAALTMCFLLRGKGGAAQRATGLRPTDQEGRQVWQPQDTQTQVLQGQRNS